MRTGATMPSRAPWQSWGTSVAHLGHRQSGTPKAHRSRGPELGEVPVQQLRERRRAWHYPILLARPVLESPADHAVSHCHPTLRRSEIALLQHCTLRRTEGTVVEVVRRTPPAVYRCS